MTEYFSKMEVPVNFQGRKALFVFCFTGCYVGMCDKINAICFFLLLALGFMV